MRLTALRRITTYKRVAILLCAVLVLLAPLASADVPQRVEVRGGSVYLIDDKDHETRVTPEGGVTAEATLSRDKSKVAYVRSMRSTDGRKISEIRIYHVANRKEELVLEGPVMIGGREYSSFDSPKFSPDGDAVYFLFDWAVTTHGVARLDLKTLEVRFVVPALDFPAVVQNGKYIGDLVVSQRRPTLSLDHYTLYYLFSPEGKEIGVVGETEFDVGIFLDPDGDLAPK